MKECCHKVTKRKQLSSNKPWKFNLIPRTKENEQKVYNFVFSYEIVKTLYSDNLLIDSCKSEGVKNFLYFIILINLWLKLRIIDIALVDQWSIYLKVYTVCICSCHVYSVEFNYFCILYSKKMYKIANDIIRQYLT